MPSLVVKSLLMFTPARLHQCIARTQCDCARLPSVSCGAVSQGAPGWPLQGNKLSSSPRLHGSNRTRHEGECELVFLAAERLQLAGSSDCTARIWNTATGRVKHVLSGHKRHLEFIQGAGTVYGCELCAVFGCRCAFDWTAKLVLFSKTSEVELPPCPCTGTCSFWPGGWQYLQISVSSYVAV